MVIQRLSWSTADFQVISKWESAVDQSLKNIHQVLVESVQPALERAVLLLEEVAGLASMCVGTIRRRVMLMRSPGWRIDEKSYTDGLDKARGLAILLERIRRLTRLQVHASEEWFRWLHYGMSKLFRKARADQKRSHASRLQIPAKIRSHPRRTTSSSSGRI
jgi:hypothetical protein